MVARASKVDILFYFNAYGHVQKKQVCMCDL